MAGAVAKVVRPGLRSQRQNCGVKEIRMLLGRGRELATRVRCYSNDGDNGYSLFVFAYFIRPVMPENSVSPRRLLLNIGLKNFNAITPG